MRPTLRENLILSDMDYTLLTAKEGIPNCNRMVVRLFVAKGGHFTVATGRPPESIRAALGDIQLSVPAISCNGALIYDLKANKALYRATLDRAQATAAITDIVAMFPEIGVEIMVGDGEVYVPRANRYTHAHQVDECIGSIACPLEEVPDGWLKVVFAASPETLDRVAHYAEGRHYGHSNYFVRTNSVYYEIMLKGVSKATALQRLCVQNGFTADRAVVIGDYYNDIDIMDEAGYAVAVANAPEEVKAHANEVTTCVCTDGAVGEFLYRLISEEDKR